MQAGIPKGQKGEQEEGSWSSCHPQCRWAQSEHTREHRLQVSPGSAYILTLPGAVEPRLAPCPPHPGHQLGAQWCGAEAWSSRTHSWFSILCISSLILMAVVSSSSSSSGLREASLSDSEVSSSLTCLRSRFRPTEAGTLTGDKCRDYRNEAGSKVGSRQLGGDGGERNGRGTERQGKERKKNRKKSRKEEKRERRERQSSLWSG